METKKVSSKGQVNLTKTVTTVVILIITIIVLFGVFNALVPEVQTSGDRFSDATKCAEAGCFSNASLTPACVINSSLEGQGACQNPIETIPLGSIFGSTGVVVILVMVFLLLIVLGIVLPSRKK